MAVDDAYMRDPDVLLVGDKEDLHILEYVKLHDRMPPEISLSIGMVRESKNPSKTSGKMDYNFTTLPDDPYHAADIIHQTNKRLMCQGERNTKDIRLTLEVLALCGEEVLAYADGMTYVMLNEAVAELYKTMLLLPEDSENTLSVDAMADPKLSKIFKESYEE
jgi:hypothetical protein